MLDDEHRPVREQLFADDIEAPVSLTQGPDGMLYYLSFTTGEMRRIRFNGVVAEARPRRPRPLAADGGVLERRHDATPAAARSRTVGLRRRRNVDRGQPVAHVHDVDAETFTASPHGHQRQPGVVDGPVPVTVGSDPPTPTITCRPTARRSSRARRSRYSGSATDPEDGAIPGSSP